MWFIETDKDSSDTENLDKGNISWICKKVTQLKGLSHHHHSTENESPARVPLAPKSSQIAQKTSVVASNDERHSTTKPTVTTLRTNGPKKTSKKIKTKSSVLFDWTETLKHKLGKEKFDVIVENSYNLNGIKDLKERDQSTAESSYIEDTQSCKDCFIQREETRYQRIKGRTLQADTHIPSTTSSSSSPLRNNFNKLKSPSIHEHEGDDASILKSIANELPDFGNASPHMGFFKGIWDKHKGDKARPNPNDLNSGTSFLRIIPPDRLRAPERLTGEEQQRAADHSKSYEGKISDYEKTAQSCVQKKKYPGATRAFFCAGVTCDNIQDYTRAQENYENMITVCSGNDDFEAQGCAYNALGCSLQECQILKLKGITKKIIPTKKEMEAATLTLLQYERALQAHTKHSEVADIPGQFVAFTNMGFVATKLAFYNEGVQSHRGALRCATKMEDMHKQGISLGNLGYLFFKREKYLASRACLSRYLQICEILEDEASQARAHFTLGNIASQLGRYIEARAEFRASLKIARRIGYEQIFIYASIQIGIVEGYIKYSGRRASFETFNPPIDLADVL